MKLSTKIEYYGIVHVYIYCVHGINYFAYYFGKCNLYRKLYILISHLFLNDGLLLIRRSEVRKGVAHSISKQTK